jgi:hypothetical protein
LRPGVTRTAPATPLLHQTIGEAIDPAPERWPDQEAIVMRDQNVRVIFAELRCHVIVSPPDSSPLA